MFKRGILKLELEGMERYLSSQESADGVETSRFQERDDQSTWPNSDLLVQGETLSQDNKVGSNRGRSPKFCSVHMYS